ncbi:C40 family peptidase [Pediococcus stilesii]|uniref:LysM peptidoglycan-binding domain-containing protein n=1 Tax=Pediococcus stilesii TaxID=331679 RepID=A0A0R2L2E1_9LACO|nr:C40 family peptidase [Pediococcus stilesii]KRN94037.1 hypothetical protein IV81_GL001680 [Pediococcus stilesii]
MVTNSKSNASKLLLAGVAGAGMLVAGGSQVIAHADSVKVQKSDTVWALSQKYGVSIKSIESLNNINQNSHLIYVGQKIDIPEKTNSDSKVTEVTVKSGDSLSLLAEKYGSSVNAIMKANNLKSSLILVGQTLKIPATNETTVAPSTTATYVPQATQQTTVTTTVQQPVVQASSAAVAQPVTQAPSSTATYVAPSSAAPSSATTYVTSSVAPSSVAPSSAATYVASSAAPSSVAPSSVATQQVSSAAPSSASSYVASSVAPSQAPSSVASSHATTNAGYAAASSVAPSSATTNQVASSAAPSSSASYVSSSQAPSSAVSNANNTTHVSSAAPSYATSNSSSAVNTSSVASSAATSSSATTVTQDTSSVTALASSLANNTIPYVWGGKTTSGFDCSGFVSYVYQHAAGISLPSYTVAMESYVTKESVSAAQPGDLLFWGSAGSTYHVAIYLGNNQYANAPTFGQNVKVSTLSSYFYPSFAGRVK